MSDVNVETTFDWETFARKYWNRAPVLYTNLADPPFVPDEVFTAATNASRRAVNLTIGRFQQDIPDAYLPTHDDGDFDGYIDRVAKQLDGQPYALMVNGFHIFDWAMWKRQRRFYRGLWQQIGVPATSAITTLFHGNYESSPVGVHKDRFATFMFALRERKRMRFWAQRPWTENVSTVLKYQEYLPSSFAVDVEPGQMLYWPSSYFHVGESGDGPPATSVNVGVPVDGHRAIYELPKFYKDYDLEMLVSESMESYLPSLDVAMTSPGPDEDGVLTSSVPDAMSGAVSALIEPLSGARLTDRAAQRSVACVTAGGYEPVPALLEPCALPDDRRVRMGEDEVCAWTPTSNGTMVCGVNGRVVETALTSDQLEVIVDRLRAGGGTVAEVLMDLPDAGPAEEGPLPASKEDGRRLLEELYRFCGVELG